MTVKWSIITESILGYSHIRKKLPNQDAYSYCGENGDYPIIASIADGHGGKDYFRSDRGSRFASDAALEALLNYYHQDPTLSTPHVDDAICREIHKIWKKTILDDIRKFPFNVEEIKIIEEGKSSRKSHLPMDPDYEIIRPYGSTVLAVIITEGYIKFFQLGDGDIVIFGGEKGFSKVIPPDDKMVGNETFSLCMPESWRDFKIRRLESVPDFIMLSTDGYANSFIDESGFIAAARDFHSFIYQAENFDSGVASIRSHMKDWLTVTSQKGSGDDITVCLIARNTRMDVQSKKNALKNGIKSSNDKQNPPESYSFLNNEPEPSNVQDDKKPGINHTICSSPDLLTSKSPMSEPVRKPHRDNLIIQKQERKTISIKSVGIIAIIILIIAILAFVSYTIINTNSNLKVNNTTINKSVFLLPENTHSLVTSTSSGYVTNNFTQTLETQKTNTIEITSMTTLTSVVSESNDKTTMRKSRDLKSELNITGL